MTTHSVKLHVSVWTSGCLSTFLDRQNPSANQQSEEEVEIEYIPAITTLMSVFTPLLYILELSLVVIKPIAIMWKPPSIMSQISESKI
jgi:hypothetical protein